MFQNAFLRPVRCTGHFSCTQLFWTAISRGGVQNMDAEIPDRHKCHCQWQEFMPFPSKKSPTWTEGVNLDMEKKSFCWTRFERDNKTPMVLIVQDQMGPCGRISIESLSGSGWVYRESIEGPMWQQAGLTSPGHQCSFLRKVLRGSKVMQCVAQLQLTNDITQRPVKAHSPKRGWDNLS